MDPQQALEAAKQLEARGSIDAAVNAYLGAGEPEEAARCLLINKRPRDAGELLLNAIGFFGHDDVTSHAVSAIEPSRRGMALKAAICFARAGEVELPVQLFVGINEVPRAVTLLRRAGDQVRAAQLEAQMLRPNNQRPASLGGRERVSAAASVMTLEIARKLEAEGKHELALNAYLHLKQVPHAARMARALGKTLQAGELFQSTGMPYEAALCFLEIGETGKALDNLTRVPRTDARYRESAIQAIELGVSIGFLDFKMENFLSRFVKSGPTSAREIGIFMNLAKLYHQHDFVENSRDALAKVLEVAPNHADANDLLAAIDANADESSTAVYDRILREDLAFRGEDTNRPRKSFFESDLPELPDLPDLPDLPGAPEPKVVKQQAAPVPVGTQALGAIPDHDPREPSPHDSDGAITHARPSHANRASQPRGSSTIARDSDIGGIATNAKVSPGTMVEPSSLAHVHKPVASKVVTGSSPLKTRKDAQSTHADADGPSAWSGFKPGAVFDDRYLLEDKLGEGGMAVVYRALDRELDELVAIKVFTQSMTDEKMVSRFKAELSVSRRLNHSNIIRLYDIGSFRGYRYITMELLVGKDMNELIVGDPVDLATGLRWLVQSARGLGAAHDNGVVHRDIKPHNIFIGDDGTVKVMDFGIAKQTHTPGMTVGNMIAGTPEYMSPEQISNFSQVSYATDIYALGVVAYQLFTGQVPFTHEELLPLLMMHINDKPKPPIELNPEIPPELNHAILTLLAKNPAERFQTCGQLEQALAKVWHKYVA